MKLRRGVQDEVLSTLDRTVLTRHAFDVTFDGSPYVVQVVFRDRPEFYFNVEPWDRNFKATECPGDYFADSEQESCFDDIESAINRVSGWLDRLLEELGGAAPRPTADQFRDEFEKGLESLPEPETPLTPVQAEEWKAKLDAAVEQIEQLHEQHEINTLGLHDLRAELDRLKGQMTSLPKRTVLRAAGARIFEYVDKKFDAALRAAIETAIKQTLGPGGGG